MHAADRRCTTLGCGRPVVIVGVGEDRGVRHVPDHDLCARCWRDLRNAERARTARPAVDRETRIRERQALEKFNRNRRRTWKRQK
jgi:hypothetical protein